MYISVSKGSQYQFKIKESEMSCEKDKTHRSYRGKIRQMLRKSSQQNRLEVNKQHSRSMEKNRSCATELAQTVFLHVSLQLLNFFIARSFPLSGLLFSLRDQSN